MTLTPEDVHNKQFTVVRLREGYDQTEVDEFLDEVEAEFRRIIDENEQMRQGLVGGAPPDDLQAARAAADEARVTDAELHRTVTDTSDAPAAALTVLTHAQTAADNLINEAHERADQLVGDATRRAEELDAETARRKEELMGDLQREEAALRAKIDELQAHEREYRSRLVAYHTEQVRRLQEGEIEDVDAEPAGSGQPDALDETSAPAPSSETE
jgi:DivIVA domain-containing protein